MRQNLCLNLRALTVESVRNSSLRLSSLGQPTHGGTAASDTFPCFSFMKASCSLLNSPSRLCEQNSIITCHTWKKCPFFRDLKMCRLKKMCILTSLLVFLTICMYEGCSKYEVSESVTSMLNNILCFGRRQHL